MPKEDRANLLLQQGIESVKAGESSAALRLFDEALALVPDNPVVNYNAGLARHQAGSVEAAVTAYRAAIESQPEFTEAWINLSHALKQLGRYEEALETGERAIHLDDGNSSAWLAKGNALRGLRELVQAVVTFRRGTEAVPEDRELKVSLANTMRELGQVQEAIQLLREIVAEHPGFAEAHRDLAHALLLNGDYREGWRENRWRWGTGSLQGAKRHQSIPEWTGQSLTGKTILLWDEQGFGDAIQFVRFVPWAAEMGAEVVIETQPELVRLFKTVEGSPDVLARGEPLPEVDYQSSLLDLPDVFRTEPPCIPNEMPYIHAGQVSKSAASDRLRVGLCWAGNPSHDNDRNRSLDFKLLKPLLELQGIDFFSLQVGSRAGDAFAEPNVQQPGRFFDFLETAQFVVTLDLVITVDSSVAHLCGALGQKVWVLLPNAPDWRWSLEGKVTCWYPDSRLFRQTRGGNWEPVINKIGNEISESLHVKPLTD